MTTSTASRTSLATYSLRMATAQTGEARRTALAEHFTRFPPVIGSVCRRRRGTRTTSTT